MAPPRSALCVLLLVLGTVACSTSPPRPVATRVPRRATSARSSIIVQGSRIPAGEARTVAAALADAHLRVPEGRLLAVRSHRVLGSDHLPGRISVDGHPATTGTRVHAGDTVAVFHGPDRVEPTREAVISVSPPEPSNLYVGGRPGRVQVLVGEVSGERVQQRVLVQPLPGRLQSPGAVALTIDDGPDPRWTPRVLALLAAAHVHATFCLIGLHVARYPRLVRDIAAGGHALCDHTWDHDEQLPRRPHGQISLEISRAAEAIRAAAGVAPLFFRAPGGNWSPFIEREARRQHMTNLNWTVDPRDWSRPGVSAILATIYRQLRPGGVILMHDGGGDRSQSLAALKILLARLPEMGYHFVLPDAGTAQPTPTPTPASTASSRAG